MKISSAILLSGAMFVLATNSHATEIRERDFQFEDSTIQFQDAPTFLVGNFETEKLSKEKKAVLPKLVLTVKQNPEIISSELSQKNIPAEHPAQLEMNHSLEQVVKEGSPESKEAYATITQCFNKPIYFSFNKTVLTKAERAKLYVYLNECKEKKTPLIVVGYTCNIGTEEQNKIIAEHRASYVANVLRQQGFNVVESVGKPKTDFVTDDQKKYYLNRRVVVAKIESHQEEK